MAIPGLLSPDEALARAGTCSAVLESGGLRQGDKPSGGTRRAASLHERLPAVAALFLHRALLEPVARLLGEVVAVAEVAFRSPEPGFGHQSLTPTTSPTRPPTSAEP